MPLAFGGNKVRSLEFWLGEALERGCDMLVIAGAPAPNQCRLTAAAAAKLGLDCLVIYAGTDPLPPHGNLLLTGMMGAQIRILGPVDEERGRLARRAVEDLSASGRRPLSDGDPVVGCLGYARAAQELHEQDVARGYCQVDIEQTKLPREQLSSSFGSTQEGSSCCLAPRGEGMTARSSILTGGKTMPVELKVVVDRSVRGKELLRMPG